MARYVALRFVTGFRCIGAACEDHCCHDWSVAVDRAHYQKLLPIVGAARFELEPANARTAESFAHLVMDEGGQCPLLDGERWCSLHKAHGEAMLPNACAMYPRVLAVAGERHEVGAELSCPEAARLCLVPRDGTDLVECAPELAGRGLVQHRSGDADAPYLRYNGAIRGALYRLVRRPRYRLDEKLFMMSCFAVETAEFFTQATRVLDGPRLSRELGRLEDELALDGLRDHFATVAGAPEVVIAALGEVLSAWLSTHVAPRFRALVRAALESLGALSDGGAETRVDAAWMTGAYARRKQERQARVAPRLDEILQRYVEHFVVQKWYCDHPDLLSWTRQLMVRVALVRLLVYCHPRGEDVDAAAIETIYSLTRALEHNREAMAAVARALETRLPSLAHVIALQKL